MRWIAGWHPFVPDAVLESWPKNSTIVLRKSNAYVWASGYPAVDINTITSLDENLSISMIGTQANHEPAAILQLARQERWAALAACPGMYMTVVQFQGKTWVMGDLAGGMPVYFARLPHGYLWTSAVTPLAALIGSKPILPLLAADMAIGGIESYGGGAPYEGIEKVPAGCLLEINSASTTVRRWHEPHADATFEAAAGQFRQALSRAVEVRKNASSLLTTDLSGGFDSSALSILVARNQPVTGITYTDPWMHERDDLVYAKAVAAAYPTISHMVIEGGPEVLCYSGLSDLDRVPFTDLPSVDVTALEFLRFKFGYCAQMGSTDHMGGEGGDPLLDVVRTNFADMFQKGSRMSAIGRTAAWARRSALSPRHLLLALRRLTKTSYEDALRELAKQLTLHQTSNQPFDARELMWWCYANPPAHWLTAEGLEYSVRLLHELAENAGGRDNNVGQLHNWQSIRHTRAHTLTTMEVGRELGVTMHMPYYDTAVVDAAMSVPGYEHISSPTQYKPLLAAAMSDMLPAVLLNRKTKGDATDSWYRGLRNNSASLMQLVANSVLVREGIFRRSAVRDRFKRVTAGVDPGDMSFDKFIATEIWLQQLDLTTSRWWEHDEGI